MNFQEQQEDIALDVDDEPHLDSSPSSAGVQEDFGESDRPQTPPTHLDESNLLMHRREDSCMKKFTDRILKPCIKGLGTWICENKVAAFMTFQIFIVFLRITRIFSESVQFWTAVVPSLILLICLLCYCYRARRREFLLRHRAIRIENNHFSSDRERLFQQLFFQMMAAENGEDRDPRDRRRMGLPGFIRGPRSFRRVPGAFGPGGFGGPQHQDPRQYISDLLFEIGLLQGFHQPPQPIGLTPQQINDIPLRPFVPNAKVSDEEPEVCSICIDEFKEAQNLRNLPCTHRFHQNCVDEWLKISKACPNCKAEIYNANQL